MPKSLHTFSSEQPKSDNGGRPQEIYPTRRSGAHQQSSTVRRKGRRSARPSPANALPSPANATLARAADYADGIGNFGLSNRPPKPTLPPGYPEKPYNQAPTGYHAAARAHGMVPCLECKLLPAVEPNHECYDCGKNLHAWCGTGLFGSKQRCHDCCWKLGCLMMLRTLMPSRQLPN